MDEELKNVTVSIEYALQACDEVIRKYFPESKILTDPGYIYAKQSLRDFGKLAEKTIPEDIDELYVCMYECQCVMDGFVLGYLAHEFGNWDHIVHVFETIEDERKKMADNEKG